MLMNVSTLDVASSALPEEKEIFRVESQTLRKGKCFKANVLDAWHVHVLHDHQRQVGEDLRLHAQPESVLCVFSSSVVSVLPVLNSEKSEMSKVFFSIFK